MIRPAVLAALLVGTACSATPQQSSSSPQAAPTGGGAPGAFTPPQPASATQPVPENAPTDAAVHNVPAREGKANLPETSPPFAMATMGDFDAPFAMAFLPDGSLLVTEKAGQLKLRAPDGQIATVAGVPEVAGGGQGGLLDVAIAPDFGSSKTIYLSFSEPGANGSALALARGTLVTTGGQPRLDDVAVIWRSGSNGPGGQFGATIAIAPDGKSLFLTSGERQRFTPAQDPEQLLGKIVRLTLDGQAAPGNPMYDAGGVRAMTWSSGHRNPYGLAFAPDGTLWETEMGPRGGDEMNVILPGRNYGWPVVSNGDNYSGQPIPDHPSKPEFQPPVLWWNPSISPGGMMIYTGTMFPRFTGSAFVAALSGEALIRVALDGTSATAADQWDMGTRIRDVAQAPDGAIWVLEDGGRGAGGKLMRLTPRS